MCALVVLDLGTGSHDTARTNAVEVTELTSCYSCGHPARVLAWCVMVFATSGVWCLALFVRQSFRFHVLFRVSLLL